MQAYAATVPEMISLLASNGSNRAPTNELWRMRPLITKEALLWLVTSCLRSGAGAPLRRSFASFQPTEVLTCRILVCVDDPRNKTDSSSTQRSEVVERGEGRDKCRDRIGIKIKKSRCITL